MDTRCLTPPSRDVSEVGSYYRVLHSTSHQSFPWKSLQKPKFPTKVSLFPLGNSFGENPHYKQPVPADISCNRLALHVQEG